MKVRDDYYSEERCYDHEVAHRVAVYCNHIKNTSHSRLMREVAHQAKCMVIKRYSKSAPARFVPLCEQWANDPGLMVDWLVKFKMASPRRIQLVKGAKEISPKTIIGLEE